ncbi:hypothetical protein BH11PSE9_BH11PSE9_02690 [soil metagenome]
MNRLQSELRRLYGPAAATPGDDSAAPAPLIDSNHKVRAMVMELKAPASWEVLGRVWHGVQAELALPAPAIAVSGTDGLQLWFSVDEAMAVPQAHALLEALRLRFLPEVDSRRIALWPAVAASSSRQGLHARPVPALQPQTGNWSAFVAPDLAAVFADTPWLDIPPGEEGQAALLRGLAVMKLADFDAALGPLAPPAAQSSGETAKVAAAAATYATSAPSATSATSATSAKAALTSESAADDDLRARTPTATLPASDDPRRFLLQVMNDEAVALALRIEAAKALLLHPPTG